MPTLDGPRHRNPLNTLPINRRIILINLDWRMWIIHRGVPALRTDDLVVFQVQRMTHVVDGQEAHPRAHVGRRSRVDIVNNRFHCVGGCSGSVLLLEVVTSDVALHDWLVNERGEVQNARTISRRRYLVPGLVTALRRLYSSQAVI